MKIFKDLDANGDGFIDEGEFKNLTTSYSRKFPQLEEYAKRTEMLFQEGDTNKDGVLSLEEFQKVLARVDSLLTSLPASAQTAQQQGRYLALALNNTLREEELQALFKKLDVDNSGGLDAREIRKGLKMLGLPSSKV
jgi:NADH dehydrogenase